ncbi:hypothetical protein Tco_1473795, partial [Tanacetum coccineum]
MLHSLDQLMERKEGGGMYLLWVLLIGDVRTLIMDEAHASRYLVHSEVDKTYYDLRDMYGGHMRRLARLYIDEIVARHGVHVSSILDHGGRFTSWVWSLVLWAEIGEIRSIGPELAYTFRVEVGDKVILEVSSWKDVVHFGKKDMLAPRYEYWTDVNMHVHLEEIKVHKTLRFVEEPVEIIDREVKSLKRSSISIVKFCWDSKR